MANFHKQIRIFKHICLSSSNSYKRVLEFDNAIANVTPTSICIEKEGKILLSSKLELYETDIMTVTYIGQFENGEQFRFLTASDTNPFFSSEPIMTIGGMGMKSWAVHFNLI